MLSLIRVAIAAEFESIVTALGRARRATGGPAVLLAVRRLVVVVGVADCSGLVALAQRRHVVVVRPWVRMVGAL